MFSVLLCANEKKTTESAATDQSFLMGIQNASVQWVRHRQSMCGSHCPTDAMDRFLGVAATHWPFPAVQMSHRDRQHKRVWVQLDAELLHPLTDLHQFGIRNVYPLVDQRGGMFGQGVRRVGPCWPLLHGDTEASAETLDIPLLL